MNNNELDKKVPTNTPKEPLQSINSPKTEVKGKSIQEPNKSISQAQTSQNPSQINLLCQQMDKLPPKTKVKVKILDFDSFRAFLPLVNKYSSKFEVFKYTTEFDSISDLAPKNIEKEKTTFKESFNNWLSQQKIDNKIKEILQKEME